MTQGEGGIDRLVYERFFAGSEPGVFVDVGAAGPEFLSVSALYLRLGLKVIAVEPNPVFCRAWRAADLKVLGYACADYDADGVDFEVVDSHGTIYAGGPVSFESLSSLRIKDAYRATHDRPPDVRRISVNVRRLDTLLAEHAPELEQVDVLSVDVEGWELEVLSGFSLERYQPRVLIVENVLVDEGYRQELDERSYWLWRHLWPNDVYVMPA